MKESVYLKLIEYIDWKHHPRWSVTYTPWGERIVCHLTIEGVTRGGVGEDGRKAFRDAAILFQELRDYLTDIE